MIDSAAWSSLWQWLAVIGGTGLLVYAIFAIFYTRPLRALGRLRREGERAWVVSVAKETKSAIRVLSRATMNSVPWVLLLRLKGTELVIQSPKKQDGSSLAIPVGLIERVEVGRTFNVNTHDAALVLTVRASGEGEAVRLPLMLQRDRAPRVFLMGEQSLETVAQTLRAFIDAGMRHRGRLGEPETSADPDASGFPER